MFTKKLDCNLYKIVFKFVVPIYSVIYIIPSCNFLNSYFYVSLYLVAVLIV